MPQQNDKKRYEKKDPIEHILLRPDMYVGSTRLRAITEFVAEKKQGEWNIYQKEISTSPAILRIFVEALSNAIDNVERSRKTKTPCTKIKISLNAITGETSIWNDGDIVPIEKDSEQDCYNHSMIFGQLLTGSNYQDSEERVVSGRNGLGIKLTNVFSTTFTVKGFDPKEKKTLSQTWTRNMRETIGPIISKETQLTKGYTEVSWTPDFEHFGLKKGYTDDIIRLYSRYIIDAAMLSKVEVFLNDELIPIKTLTQYSALYDTPTNESLLIKTKDSEVLITPAKEYQTISFVNGVYTRLGGQHVDAWAEALFRPIVDKFNEKNTKNKTPKINITDVRQFFRLFVVSTVVRPEFDGQDKNKLESPVVEAIVKKTHLSEIAKWSVMDNIEDIIRAKELVVLKKAEKVSKKTKIEGYDRANKSGTKDSTQCTLFITEGLSAKTYVVAGIDEGLYGKSGRDWNGILPVRGKLLNVRDKPATTIADNKVICSLIHALELRLGIDYQDENNFKKLNYGRVSIVADADVDGVHIEGLILNFFHSLYPTLLQREQPFVVSMKTPIARIIKKTGDLLFYDERRFHQFLGEQKSKCNVKYYKGLGTTKAEDVPDTFGLKMVEFINDENSFTSMQKAFHKKYADNRKIWLEQYNPEAYTFSLDDQGKTTSMSITNFINGELIKFSHADCARSIPNGIDGLKESQRKILYAVKKKNLRFSGKSLKVAQLAGFTAEHSDYHHGENNLLETIIGMAQEFPGSNNIPLLYRDGMFGTRLEGGQDSANGRYIFTKMDALTELIFREEDEPILTYVRDDGGNFIEPEFYVPIIPMMLINGCSAGIGTGFSCKVPCYNPIDMVEAIKIWLDNDGEVIIQDPDDPKNIVSLFPEFIPWYRGFIGEIEKNGENRFISYGIIEEVKKNSTIEVKELPVSMWTSHFAEFCEDLKTDKKLKSVSNYSSTKNIHFVLTEDSNFHSDIDSLKLHSYLYTSNMVMFNEKVQIKKHDTIDSILDNFCRVRFDYYEKRKRQQLDSLEAEIRYLGNKERFVSEVLSKKIKIMNEKEVDIITELQSRKYDEDPKKTEGEGGYDYLLKMSIRTFTVDKILQLRNDITSLQEKLHKLREKSEKEIWISELEEFEIAYKKWISEIEQEIAITKKRRVTKTKK
jgi:DNA topoisomerase-2